MLGIAGTLCTGCDFSMNKNTPPQTYEEWQKKYDRPAYDAQKQAENKTLNKIKNRKKLPPQSYEEWQKKNKGRAGVATEE